MEISKTHLPNVSVAVLQGRLDTANAAAVEEALLPALATTKLVLDLEQVRFVSSAGLRVLLKAAKAAKAAGTGFVLCALQPTVREVYQISGFDQIIPLYDARDEAVRALG